MYKFLILSLFVFGAWADDRVNNVHILNDDNFAQHLKNHKHTVVLFVNAGCDQCRATRPKYESAAGMLIEENLGVTSAYVDCAQSSATCADKQVTAFPTIRLFIKSGAKTVDLPESTPRKTQNIIDFVKAELKKPENA